ncbi:MAG: spore maturation protein [Ignavibacteriae bacterium]|nr:spore maturation protein [Ignavibacteriota bacterium]
METFVSIIQTISVIAIPGLVLFIVVYGAIKKVKIYTAFVEGAKEGFDVAVRIIPYLVAMLVAIGIFRASGAMDFLFMILSPITNFIGMPSETLPMALVRPLSGSGALGVMSETFKAHGADSLIGRMVSVMMGSGETTFYVLAVYFGAVGVTKTRQAVPAGIIADVVAILMSVWLVNAIWG